MRGGGALVAAGLRRPRPGGANKGPRASRSGGSRSGGAVPAQGVPSPEAVRAHLVRCRGFPVTAGLAAAAFPPRLRSAPGRGARQFPPTAGRGRGGSAAILSQGPRSIGMSRVELPGGAARVWGCRRGVPATRSPRDCRWRAKHFSPRPGRRASLARPGLLRAPRLLRIRSRAPARAAHPAPNPPEALGGGARAPPRKAWGTLMFNLIQASGTNASLPRW